MFLQLKTSLSNAKPLSLRGSRPIAAFKGLQTNLKQVKDQRISPPSGGGYVPPAPGPGLARLVGYIETGAVTEVIEGKTKLLHKVHLLFELVGQRHPPKVMEDGTRVPSLLKISLNLSTNKKATFRKLLAQMDPLAEVAHASELVLNPDKSGFRVTVYHSTFKNQQGNEVTYATLKDPVTKTFSIFAPRVAVTDPETGEETGEFRAVAVPPPISSPKLFIWEIADREQWDSLHIAGEDFEERADDGTVLSTRSRNVWQDMIRKAENFKGSPIQAILEGGADLVDMDDDIPF